MKKRLRGGSYNEDEEVKKKIESMDVDLIKRYLLYREDAGMFNLGNRRFGSLGIRGPEESKEVYDQDTDYMRMILRKKMIEDEMTRQKIDAMDSNTLRNFIIKRTHQDKKINKTDGNLATRTELTDTKNNYLLDTGYLKFRLKSLVNPQSVNPQILKKASSARTRSKKKTSLRQSIKAL
jgi:hypothetical protein